METWIFLGFLALNLAVGLYYGRGVKTIRDYALGGRNFSTGTLVSTVVATWIGGDYLFITMAEVYNTGLHYTIGCLGMVICLLLNAYVFAPKMREFLGSISVASAMGDLYGEKVRIISAVAGTIASAGFIAVQFKVFGYILNNFIGLPGNYPIFIAAVIVVIYSAFGGIRSVTFTDVLQFFTFGVLIPVLGIVVWNDLSNVTNFDLAVALEHPLFDYKQFIGLENPKFWSVLLLLILFSIPDLNPTMFQRVAIGRSVEQVKKAFAISALVLTFILLGMAWIAFLLFNINPNLEANNLVQYLIDTYSHTGIKSFIMVGVVAMCMSTADSNINASSVLLTHDFCNPLNIKFKSELVLSKILSLLLGLAAIYLALLDYDLLPLVFMTQSFYIPIIDVPLILAILGFRSTTKAVLIGMGAGLISVFIWRVWFMDATGVDSILPATFVNLFFFMGSHYLLKQKGGWTKKEKDTSPIEESKQGSFIGRMIKPITEFNLLTFLKNNSPKSELTYSGFGIFCTISTICTMYSVSNSIVDLDKSAVLVYYEIMLVLSVFFMTYPIWPVALKKEVLVRLVWNISVFFLLIFSSSFFLMLTNFSELQVVVFIVNIIVAAILTRWKLVFGMIIAGIYLSTKAYEYYAGPGAIQIDLNSTSLIFYGVLLSAAAIVIFLKPKQEYEELTEEKNEHLNGRISAQEKQLREALELRGEFIRNVSHEYHAPMTGIVSMAQVLWESYDNLKDDQRRMAAETIFKSSVRLESFDSNIATLSKLSKAGYELKLESVDLSKLLNERIDVCRKLYEENREDRDFILNIDKGVVINCDKHYLSQVLDNLIINAIIYCQQGKITVDLKHTDSVVTFSISDEGIGIPPAELKDIFSEFTVSSRTRTPAGGRGVGLALCKRVLEVHDGKIHAESNGTKGATFKFVIPRG